MRFGRKPRSSRATLDRSGGYVTAHMTGEPDAPTLVPNIDGQRLLRQFKTVRARSRWHESRRTLGWR